MKNKETLEEAAKFFNESFENYDEFVIKHNQNIQNSFIAGARWQQERMYNEIELFLNEVKDKIDSFEYSINQQSYLSEYITELFEQFKNK